jgi:hypothetical protein
MATIIGHFCLCGDFDADEITTMLGITPSSVIRKGEVWEDGGSPATSATWDLHCPDDKTLQEQVEFSLAMLWPREAAIRTLTNRFNADLNITCDYENGAQLLTLKPETLQKLASLNITLNCFYLEDEDAN